MDRHTSRQKSLLSFTQFCGTCAHALRSLAGEVGTLSAKSKKTMGTPAHRPNFAHARYCWEILIKKEIKEGKVQELILQCKSSESHQIQGKKYNI